MGADQTLINSVKSMGPSRFRDDSSWLKALSAVGKYTAVKRKQFQNATENFNGVIEDVDIDGLVEYKDEVNSLLKTMKNVPAFMPKYKKASNRYNEIMSNIEGTKKMLSGLAEKKVKLGTNSANLSLYQNPSEVAIDADVMTERYKTKMSDNGPLMVFENGTEILVSDYIAKKPILISDSKTSNDNINTVIDTYGANAKRNNEAYAAETVKLKINEAVDVMWANGNDPTTILYNTNYETKDGTTTFMDYLAKTDPNYIASLQEIEQPEQSSQGPFYDWSKHDIPSDAYIQEQANILKIGLWKEGDQNVIKQKYKQFLQEEVINHQYQVNQGKKYDKNTGKLITDASLYMGMSRFSNSSLYVNEQVVRNKAQNLMNPKLGDIENWYEGDDIRYKAVYMTAPGTDAPVLTDDNNKPIIGWQEIDKEGNLVGDPMSIDYTVKNTFNITNPELKTKKIIKY